MGAENLVDLKAFELALADTKSMVLATSQNDYVTARVMSPISEGLTIFFRIQEQSQKGRQMQGNQRVALCFDHYQIEGTARFTGGFDEPQNAWLRDLYAQKYSAQFGETDAFTTNGDVFVAIDIVSLKQWIYREGVPVELHESYFPPNP